MPTTPTPSTNHRTMPWAIAVVALLGMGWGQGAHAQVTGGGTHSSRAQKLEWPRTFSGQPDFVFTREEALLEARARATRENEPMPLTPSLQQLLADDSVLDPLGINAPKAVSSTLEVDPSDTSIAEDSPEALQLSGQSLMARLMAQAEDLPTVAATAKPDLSEFRAQLNATISRTIANWQPEAGEYDFSNSLNSLALQAIVTSPVRYAVINQQKYAEGETFRITVPMPVPQVVITNAMDAQMPRIGTLTPALQTSYEEAYKEVLDLFNARRNKSPDIGQQTLVLPVRVTAISPRQVMLDVNGQPHALTIRYAY